MRTIRSFISIPLAPGIQSGAVSIVKKLKPLDDAIKWVPTDNLHLTLKFLGDVDNTEVHEVCRAIRSVTDQFEPFELIFAGAGASPSAEKPKMLYAGVQDPTGSLVAMVGMLETKLAELRFKREPRDYKPQLTLGRTRGTSGRASGDLMQALGSLADVALGEMVVDELNLMASFLDKSGPTYQVMDTIEFGD